MRSPLRITKDAGCSARMSWPNRRATSLPSTRMSGIADPPVPKMNDPVSARCKCLAVGRDQDGNACTTLLAQQAKNGAFRDCIDLAGRLIGEKYAGRCSQSDSETCPNQFTSRQLTRPRCCAISQADCRHQIFCPVIIHLPRNGHRELDVVCHGER